MIALANDAFTFLNKREYVDDLIRHVTAAQKSDRVLLVTHTFKPTEGPIATLLSSLADAAQRGVEVSLILDARTLPLLRKLPSDSVTQRALKRLQLSGGTHVITNQTYRRLLNPFAGRSHIKLAIVNDDVYVGGCNLDKMSEIDMMVRWRDRSSANWLYKLMQNVLCHSHTQAAFGERDQQLVLDTQTNLLLDAGKPRQSVIFDQALTMIEEAKEWIVLTCQFLPNSTTIKHLADAYKRGVSVSLYYNHPGKHRLGHNMLHHVVLLHERRRHPSALFKHQLHKDTPFLHAKLLATEKGAMIGSHNYVTAGVNFGTAELTLLRQDRDFAKHAVQHFLNQIDLAK